LSIISAREKNVVRRFEAPGGPLTDCRDITFSQFVDKLHSGEARAHDIYWAMHELSSADDQSLLVEYFEQIETSLQLTGSRPYVNPCNNRRASSPTSRNYRLTSWVGADNHVENLHYDDEDNLHLVLTGAKEWLLIPPGKLADLNYHSLTESLKENQVGAPSSSEVGKDPATTSENPLNHNPTRILLQPGQALYLPAAWSHQVAGAPSAQSPSPSTPFIFSVNRYGRERSEHKDDSAASSARGEVSSAASAPPRGEISATRLPRK
jgi:hypothetical protein